MDNLFISFDRNGNAGCTSFSFGSIYQNLEMSGNAKIFQFSKVACAIEIDCDDITLNNDEKYLLKAVKLISKGSIECTTEKMRTFGEYKDEKKHHAR